MSYALLLHLICACAFVGSCLCLLLLSFGNDAHQLARPFYKIAHAIQAPTLTILLLSGLYYSSTRDFIDFKGAGYMHAKTALYVAVLVLVFAQIRVLKRAAKQAQQGKAWVAKVRLYTTLITLMSLSILAIITLKPF